MFTFTFTPRGFDDMNQHSFGILYSWLRRYQIKWNFLFVMCGLLECQPNRQLDHLANKQSCTKESKIRANNKATGENLYVPLIFPSFIFCTLEIEICSAWCNVSQSKHRLVEITSNSVKYLSYTEFRSVLFHPHSIYTSSHPTIDRWIATLHFLRLACIPDVIPLRLCACVPACVYDTQCIFQWKYSTT